MLMSWKMNQACCLIMITDGRWRSPLTPDSLTPSSKRLSVNTTMTCGWIWSSEELQECQKLPSFISNVLYWEEKKCTVEQKIITRLLNTPPCISKASTIIYLSHFTRSSWIAVLFYFFLYYKLTLSGSAKSSYLQLYNTFKRQQTKKQKDIRAQQQTTSFNPEFIIKKK